MPQSGEEPTNPILELEAEVRRLERMQQRQDELGLRPSTSLRRRWKEALRELAHARTAAGVTPRDTVDPRWFVDRPINS